MPDSAADAGKTTLRCPDDDQALVARVHAGVEIDVCSRCGGVWFDADELDRLREGDRPELDLDDLDPGDGVTDEGTSNAPDAGGADADADAGSVIESVLEFLGDALSGW